MRNHAIGFRVITPMDMFTPICHFPMQRTILPVAEPFGLEQVKDSLMLEFGDVVECRNHLYDVEWFRC